MDKGNILNNFFISVSLQYFNIISSRFYYCEECVNAYNAVKYMNMLNYIKAK